MTSDRSNTLWKLLWDRLLGEADQFKLEHRAFHAICLFTLFLLCVFVPVCFYVEVYELIYLILVLLTFLVIVYYMSRVRRLYGWSVFCYALFGYGTLALNYYYNSGITGPSLLLFVLAFQLLISISPTRIHVLWLILHLLVAAFLLYWEYSVPDVIEVSYKTRQAYFIDVGVTYVLVLIFIYLVTFYLFKIYHRERRLAKERSHKIANQNDLIMSQNFQLERLNQEKDKILFIISHDLRSPLSSIQSFLEMEDKLDPSERDEMLKALLEHTRRTSDMLSNLLLWSQAQIKGKTPPLKPIQVWQAVEQSIEVQKQLAREKSVYLHTDANRDFHVLAEENMLQIVLRNLVNNAIKFTHPGGTIRIEANEHGEEIWIKVTDSGIGIPEDRQKELFSMNIAASYGTKQEKGMGLGLLLSKEYVHRMGGSIWFESKVDSGTTFFVALPACSAPTIDITGTETGRQD